VPAAAIRTALFEAHEGICRSSGNVVGAGEDSQCARHRRGCRFVHRVNACMGVG
jgi:hypothetical protein